MEMDPRKDATGKALFEAMKDLDMIAWATGLGWEALHPDTQSQFIDMAEDVLAEYGKWDGRLT